MAKLTLITGASGTGKSQLAHRRQMQNGDVVVDEADKNWSTVLDHLNNGDDVVAVFKTNGLLNELEVWT